MILLLFHVQVDSNWLQANGYLLILQIPRHHKKLIHIDVWTQSKSPLFHVYGEKSSSLRYLDPLCLLSAGLVTASEVWLGFSACTPSPSGESVQWFGRRVLIPSAEAADYVSSEWGCEETIDDRIAARVEIAEDEESVMDVFWHHLQHTRLKPVPDAHQVVRGPAHYKWCHDDDSHLQGLHACFWDYVGPTVSQTRFPTYKTQCNLEEQ